MYSSPDRLFAVATRVLGACARGAYPNRKDVRFLSRHARGCEISMQPAELAGATIWRVHNAAREMKPAA